MKLIKIKIRNFRRLENVEINVEDGETVFVGPNNSGKTSATTAFRLFLVRQDFKIHDFTVSRIADIDIFGSKPPEESHPLPTIELDLWFSINPKKDKYGRVSGLFTEIPNKLENIHVVGIRLKYSVKDVDKLRTDYNDAKKKDRTGTIKSLSHYLSMANNLNNHFEIKYFALDHHENEHPRSPSEGKKLIRSLIRIDFIDAQRNMDDQELGRSNRLSSAFTEFYKKNLEQAEVSEEANKVIGENNQSLTDHYESHFGGLIEVIHGLGFPSINDRKMQLISSLSPETLLQGNTTLLYVDEDSKHELPEAYNGLGFKNLVYMAIQVSHFHTQWMQTKEKRPLCQIIFIEEPEVHLHAQVQQTFIQNIWKIVNDASTKADEPHMVPQVFITTHSSHILDTVDFGKARYFKRCGLEGEPQSSVTKLRASKVMNLHEFKTDVSKGENEDEKKEALVFLEKYLELTHCDLFFADAAILIEGTSEKILLPKMIEKCAPKLRINYLTILEVGGAYAHKLAEILHFIGLPYLIITDLDSVDPSDNGKACRADTQGAVSSNGTLKHYLKREIISDLMKLKHEEKILNEGGGFIAFQTPTQIGTSPNYFQGRTFEEDFIYRNIDLVRDNKIKLNFDISTEKGLDDEYKAIYEGVRSSLKKTEFALDVATTIVDWTTPSYIEEGLRWLEKRIATQS
mgnify:CR=1 FL=1